MITPLNEQAYTHLKYMIDNRELSYSEIYSETKLSRELGISRTPLRDAIHRLAQEGYIDIIPSKGFQIHQLSEQDVYETFQVRSALEGFCAYQIALEYESKKAKRLFHELDWIMEEAKKILDTTHSVPDFIQYDFEFHEKIVNYLENEQFSSTFAVFLSRMIRLAEQSLQHEGRMANTYKEHMAILDAMKAGDVNNIYKVTLEHMNNPQKINLYDLGNL